MGSGRRGSNPRPPAPQLSAARGAPSRSCRMVAGNCPDLCRPLRKRIYGDMWGLSAISGSSGLRCLNPVGAGLSPSAAGAGGYPAPGAACAIVAGLRLAGGDWPRRCRRSGDAPAQWPVPAARIGGQLADADNPFRAGIFRRQGDRGAGGGDHGLAGSHRRRSRADQ